MAQWQWRCTAQRQRKARQQRDANDGSNGYGGIGRCDDNGNRQPDSNMTAAAAMDGAMATAMEGTTATAVDSNGDNAAATMAMDG
jgi:hypothetical protein